MVESQAPVADTSAADTKRARVEGLINAVRANGSATDLQALLSDPDVMAAAQSDAGIAVLQSFISSDITSKQAVEILNAAKNAGKEPAAADTAIPPIAGAVAALTPDVSIAAAGAVSTNGAPVAAAAVATPDVAVAPVAAEPDKAADVMAKLGLKQNEGGMAIGGAPKTTAA